MMTIPIKNIYYLLCYAWDKLDERDLVAVDAESFKELPDLLAKVLVTGIKHLFKKGLDRSYIDVEENYSGIKGKLDFASSIKANTFSYGQTMCRFDELEYDILHNQILKAMLKRINQLDNLDRVIYHEAKKLILRFHNVSDLDIESRHFAKVAIHRNNKFYRFLLDVAQILYDNLLLNQKDGKWRFRDFVRDEQKMAALFEKFMFNFYKLELKNQYDVRSDRLRWNAEAIDNSSLSFLPVMNTDISLTAKDKKIVLDAKYYKEAMTSRFDGQSKFLSNHLYQMHAYLTNISSTIWIDKQLEGVLIYPTTTEDFKQSYKMNNFKISLRTLNLNQEWSKIDFELRSIVGVCN